MITLGDVFRRFADDYCQVHGRSLLPSHGRAIADILACRTPALGGHRWRCNQCSAEVHAYHSCKNRSCPTCHRNETERWLAARKAELLPCPYFHVTVTVPAVLHTWTHQLVYHPHVHCLVTGGGVSADGRSWCPSRTDYLLPTKALARLVCGKLRAALAKRRPDLVVPEAVWKKPWVADCTAWGNGTDAVLEYLARYVHRVAITNSRIVDLDDSGVTIGHKDRGSGRSLRTRLSGHEFMRRFLQHVLPKGLHKIRYYGLWHPSRREQAACARQLLQLDQPANASRATTATEARDDAATTVPASGTAEPLRVCPCCKEGRLVQVGRLYPKQASGP